MVQTSITNYQFGDARQTVAVRTKGIWLKKTETPEDRKLVSDIIIKYHSYVKNTRACGRQINYLVYLNGKVIGCIGGQSPPIPLSKCVQDYFQRVAKETLGLSDADAYQKATSIKDWALPHLANNWKFALTPEAPHNTGSKILRIFLLMLANDWKLKYGDELKWVITYVGAGKTGTVYKAAGWQYLGESKGHHFKGALYRSSVAIKDDIAYDNRVEEWVDIQPKKIFIKAIRL